MLIISRRVGEKLYIGDDITLTITRNHGGQTGIGIDAPKEMKIVRAELVERDAKAEEGPVSAGSAA